jgi:hypothetical protein
MRRSRAQDARRPPPSLEPRRRGRRLRRILLLVVAGLYVPYLIAGNVVLRTQLIQKVLNAALEGSTAGIVVTYDRIWTFFPGQIWIQGAVVRGHDYDFEWMVHVDDHVAWIDPLAFARRTFRVLRARGTGVEFRLRARRDASERGDATLKLLPPISGYADPPLHPDVPRPKPIGPNDHIWSVRLDDVQMDDVREIWIETLRWRDSGVARGGFSFTPGQSLAVSGELDVRDGELRRGDVTLLDHAHGRTRVAILPIDLEEMDAHSFLRHLVVSGHLETEIRSVAVVPALAEAGVVHVTVEARLAVTGRMRMGVLAPGSAARLAITRAAVYVGDVAVAVRGEAKARVRPAGAAVGRSALVALADLSAIDVTRVAGAGGDLLQGSLRVGIVSPTLDLGATFDPGKVSVDADGLLANAGLIAPWLPAAIVSPSGAASFDARVRFDTADSTGERNAGRITIDAPALSFKLEDLAVRGHLSSDIVLTRIAFPGGPSHRLDGAIFHVTGSRLELRDVSITKPGRHATEAGWWLRLEVPGAEVRPGASALRARLTTRFRDADPILMLLDRALKFPAVMLKPLTRAAFDARATIRYRPGLFAFEDFHIDGGTFRMEGWYRRDGARRCGAFLAEMGGLAVGVNVTSDKVRAVVARPRDWYAGVVRPR